MAVLSLVFPHVWQLELQTLGTFNVIHSCGMAVVPLIVVWKYKYLQTLKTKALTDKVSKATTPWTGTFPLRVFHWQSQFSWVMCIPFNANGILVKSLERIFMRPKRGTEWEDRAQIFSAGYVQLAPIRRVRNEVLGIEERVWSDGNSYYLGAFSAQRRW